MHTDTFWLTKIRSKTFPDEAPQEEVREGFNPDAPKGGDREQMHNMDMPFTIGDDEDEDGDEDKPEQDTEPHGSTDELGQGQPWENREYGESSRTPQYGSFKDERNAWND